MKLEILYGIHPVTEALKAGRREFIEIYVTRDNISKRVQRAVVLAESLQVPVKKITPSQLRSKTGSAMHQGIGATVSTYPLADMHDILSRTGCGNARHFILLLDNIIDPHNLGALIRTANCVGVDGIVIPKDRSAPPSAAVSKASAGALEHVILARVTNMAATIKMLTQQGIWIVGMERQADSSIFGIDLTVSVAIVIGGEEKGIRPLVKKNCDVLISIPQMGNVDSLNASAAGAVVMYEVLRQRGQF